MRACNISNLTIVSILSILLTLSVWIQLSFYWKIVSLLSMLPWVGLLLYIFGNEQEEKARGYNEALSSSPNWGEYLEKRGSSLTVNNTTTEDRYVKEKPVTKPKPED